MSNFERRDAAAQARGDLMRAYYAKVDTYPALVAGQRYRFPRNFVDSVPCPDHAVTLQAHDDGIVIVDNYGGTPWSRTVWPDEAAALECIRRWNNTEQNYGLQVIPTPVMDDVDDSDIATVVDFVTERMIHAADRGHKHIRYSDAAEEIRRYAVPLTSDMARHQDLYEVVELLQSPAVVHHSVIALDTWIDENREREWELVGMETGTVYGLITARNAQHAHAAGEDIDANEDLETRLVAGEA